VGCSGLQCVAVGRPFSFTHLMCRSRDHSPGAERQACAVCCSALQCVAVFSVLSCVAVRRPSPGTDPRSLDVHREKGTCNVLQCAAATFQAILFPELLYLCVSTFTVLLQV